MLGLVIFRSILHPFLFPLIWYGVELSILSQYPPSPARTLHLPSEVLKNIASFSDQFTLHSLIQVSWRTYDVSSPYLYHQLTITRENARKVFKGLARSPPSVRTYRKKSSVGGEHKGREGTKDNERDIMDLPFGIFPPDITMDSEDEDEEELESERRTKKFDYPTRRSHERKAPLLSHVKRLTIASLASKHISEDFKAHRGLLYDKNKRFPFIFDKVNTQILTDQAVLDLQAWLDRHEDSAYSISCHPFFSTLCQTIKPRYLCITYPSIDQTHSTEYINSRTSLQRGYPIRELGSKVNRELTRRFKRSCVALGGNIHGSLISRFKKTLEEVTLHNFRIGRIPTSSTSTRVFFNDCTCDPTLPPIHPKEVKCLQHTTRAGRILQLAEIGKPKRKRVDGRWVDVPEDASGRRWEFVSPSQGDSTISGTSLEEWSGLGQEAGECEKGFEKLDVKMVMNDEADVCRCCGGK